MKKILYFILLIPILLLSTKGSGQTTIGSRTPPSSYSLLELSTINTKGGVRMPHLTTKQRNALTTKKFIADPNANGLTIYNMDTKCIEYWNARKWISMCKGEMSVEFSPELDEKNPFPDSGDTRGPYTPSENPPCTGQIPYSYLIITGNNFTSLEVTNSDTGAFSIRMDENTTAVDRTAIVRMTNNCTDESKDFLFSQKGNTALCNTSTTKPTIETINGSTLCAAGAVYMKITNVVAGVDYIWTINNTELGRGTTFAATRGGTYQVYVGGIGCDSNASDKIIVTTSTTAAPTNPITLSADNNGTICGTGNSVTLTAFNVPTGTLAWYKNGEKNRDKTENKIILGSDDVGEWFAVMEQDSCTSKPSNTITIRFDNTKAPLSTPVVTVNGKALKDAIFCKNGRLKLEVSNINDYRMGVTIKWYNGVTPLGEGQSLTITSPLADTFNLRCVVSDNTNAACPSEVLTTKKITETAPAKPIIIADPASICGGTWPNLTASITGSGTYTYQWYKDGNPIEGKTAKTLTVSEIGSYQVEVIVTGECISPLSPIKKIVISDFPSVSWSYTHENAGEDETKTFKVTSPFAPTIYTWEANNGATIENGQGADTVGIRFPAKAIEVTITVFATNECGTGPSLSQTVTVGELCEAVTINKINMNPKGSVIAGNDVTMSVTASGTPPITYKWKKGGTDIPGATSATYTINNVKLADNGEYSCEVNNCEETKKEIAAGTINVIDIEEIPKGNGTLAGQACFDIAYKNQGTGCGDLKWRSAQKADFNKGYVYTFTSSGATTDLIFVKEDPKDAVEKFVPQEGIPATLLDGGKYTVTVTYKNDLMTSDLTEPINVTIYALYKVEGKYHKTQLTVTIKDCACCGAYIAPGVWKNFMCHNLEADESLDPFIPRLELIGGLYQWGRNLNGLYSDPAPRDSWSNTTKTETDPCPTGYRVPTPLQWQGVINNNAFENVGNFSTKNTSGTKIGSSLFLPAYNYLGNNAIYQSSGNGYIVANTKYFYYDNLSEYNWHNYSFAIRCIEE